MRDLLLALAALEHNLLLAKEFAAENQELEADAAKKAIFTTIVTDVDALYTSYMGMRHTLRQLMPAAITPDH